MSAGNEGADSAAASRADGAAETARPGPLLIGLTGPSLFKFAPLLGQLVEQRLRA